MFLISQNLNETCILYVLAQVLTTSIIDRQLKTIFGKLRTILLQSLYLNAQYSLWLDTNMLKRKPIIKHDRPNP